MIDLKATTPLTNEEVKALAPSVFSTQTASTVSKHYTHIPTTKVMDDMKALGWDVVDAKEVQARKAGTKGVQKHLLTFRNPNVVITGDDGDTVYPQILLTNSHDGKNAFKFQAGLFRMICENGLVIATTTYDEIKMRHMGYTFEDLQIKINGMVERLPLTVESMNHLREVEMEEEAQLDFAEKALACRFTEDELKAIDVDIKALLTPTRKEDRGNDVWTTFNVLQEKMIHGLFDYTNEKGKKRKARAIQNFKQDIKVNEDMYKLALEYA